jgi:cold shock protein
MRNDHLDIRRPELKGVRRPGTVRWFKDEKGYGRLTADDGEVLFVHFSAMEAEGYRTLEPGQRVTFVCEWRNPRPRPPRGRVGSPRALLTSDPRLLVRRRWGPPSTGFCFRTPRT